MTLSQPLATLSIADSTFHCYISTTRCLSSLSQLYAEFKAQHPTAAHIPYAASLEESKDRIHDDDEPAPAQVGKELLRVLHLYKRGLTREETMK
eukprot:scaffold127996_cov34-Cyclotella_meneghiniana.AAC.1